MDDFMKKMAENEADDQPSFVMVLTGPHAGSTVYFQGCISAFYGTVARQRVWKEAAASARRRLQDFGEIPGRRNQWLSAAGHVGAECIVAGKNYRICSYGNRRSSEFC